jgi:hypothetical protein
MPNETQEAGRATETSTHAETAPAVEDDATPATSPRGRRLGRSVLLVGVGFLLGALIPLPDGPFGFSADVPSRRAPDPTPTTSPASVVDQFSFTSTSEQEDGWRHYESAVEGVSLDLPPNWGPFPTESGGPDLIFNASDSYPFAGYGAALWVIKSDIGRTPSDAARYWSMWRRHIQTTIDVIGDVSMTKLNLPAGEAYVLRYAASEDGTEYSETMYGLLNGSAEYRLVFQVSSDRAHLYEDVFDEIADTFTLM